MNRAKKLIALFLASAIVLGLCACNGDNTSGNENKTGLQVGYARESIMPQGQVNMAGYADIETRISTGYLDILYTTCVAFSENGNTALIFSSDLLRSTYTWTQEARNRINQATGVPAGNIMMAATHTHHAPAPDNGYPLCDAYKNIFMDAVVNAAKNAIADLAPATLYGAKAETENLAYVRHYVMSDGSYSGNNFGNHNLTHVGYATEADEQMVLIKIDREGDKQDIAIMNWNIHPCFLEYSTILSADIVGTTRDTFEKETGMHFIYFTGDAGNQNPYTRIANEPAVYKQGREAYAAALVKYATEALVKAEKIEGTGIFVSEQTLTYPCNRYGLERLADAKIVADEFKRLGSGSGSVMESMAAAYGFQSVYEATGIVNNSTRPATYSTNLCALNLGGMGIIFAPYEMFSGSGMYIKENSPFKYTVLASCANDSEGYFATKDAWEYGCYETYGASYAEGVAEAAAEKFVEMLKGLQ